MLIKKKHVQGVPQKCPLHIWHINENIIYANLNRVPQKFLFPRNIINIFIRESLSREFFCITQFAKVYPKNFASFSPRESFSELSISEYRQHFYNNSTFGFYYSCFYYFGGSVHRRNFCGLAKPQNLYIV